MARYHKLCRFNCNLRHYTEVKPADVDTCRRIFERFCAAGRECGFTSEPHPLLMVGWCTLHPTWVERNLYIQLLKQNMMNRLPLLLTPTCC